jgi:hypothetical protein
MTSLRFTPKPSGDEFVLQLAGMHQHHIDVAGLTELERLAGADGDHVDLAIVLLLEGGEQDLEQAGVLGRGGGRHLQTLLGGGNAAEQQAGGKCGKQNTERSHGKVSCQGCRLKT